METAFESIRQGMTEAIEFAQGNTGKSVVNEFSSVNIKALRERVGMSQTEFASIFGIKQDTLQHWERGDRKPRGPALALLNVLSREPKAVLRALSANP